MTGPRPPNDEIGEVLERIANLLEAQEAHPFRVRAYRNAARTVRRADRALADLVEEEGASALRQLPGIGESIAPLIDEYVHTGRSSLLQRLEGQVSPEELFSTVPGIGDTLARRLHRELGVDTLEEPELAAHDGRLQEVEGFGERRIQALRDVLARILKRSSRRRARRRRWLETDAEAPAPARPEGPESRGAPERPPVEILLSVDTAYREKAREGQLPTIAPRRFNPEGASWLPILYAERDGWSFTALFSNTARAHELGRTRDWVVLYYERNGQEDQATVVTERSGPLEGRRVVRGREEECADVYGVSMTAAP